MTNPVRTFPTIANSGSNGEDLLTYSEPLYEAFKAAMLDSSASGLLSNQPDPQFTRREERQRADSYFHKAGPWVATNERSSQPLPAMYHWCRTIRFAPGISMPALNQLIGRFKEETGLERLPFDSGGDHGNGFARTVKFAVREGPFEQHLKSRLIIAPVPPSQAAHDR